MNITGYLLPDFVLSILALFLLFALLYLVLWAYSKTRRL